MHVEPKFPRKDVSHIPPPQLLCQIVPKVLLGGQLSVARIYYSFAMKAACTLKRKLYHLSVPRAWSIFKAISHSRHENAPRPIWET